VQSVAISPPYVTAISSKNIEDVRTSEVRATPGTLPCRILESCKCEGYSDLATVSFVENVN
jgi:hypothetical protein